MLAPFRSSISATSRWPYLLAIKSAAFIVCDAIPTPSSSSFFTISMSPCPMALLNAASASFIPGGLQRTIRTTSECCSKQAAVRGGGTGPAQQHSQACAPCPRRQLRQSLFAVRGSCIFQLQSCFQYSVLVKYKSLKNAFALQSSCSPGILCREREGRAAGGRSKICAEMEEVQACGPSQATAGAVCWYARCGTG